MARRTIGTLDVGPEGLLLTDTRVFTRAVRIPVEDIEEFIIDTEGVRVGADRLRFSAAGSPLDGRYLFADRAGTRLLSVDSARPAPNVAIVLHRERSFPLRVRGSVRDARFPGIAVALHEPHTAIDVLGAIAPVRIAGHISAIAPRVEDVEVVGTGDFVRSRLQSAILVPCCALSGSARVSLLTAARGWFRTASSPDSR
jgi:hypothetical protein